MNIFFYKSKFGKERIRCKCLFLSQLSLIDRDLRELTSVRILTLCWLLPVFQVPIFRLRRKYSVSAGLIMGHPTVKWGRKITPLPF